MIQTPQRTLKPIVVNSLYEIRRVVAEFVPSNKPKEVMVRTQMTVSDDTGKVVTVNLEAPTDNDYHTLLIQGFDILKRRSDAASRTKNRVISDATPHWLDQIITRRLGGKRDGLRIRWDVPEGTFFYDPFTGSLAKCISEPSSTSSCTDSASRPSGS